MSHNSTGPSDRPLDPDDAPFQKLISDLQRLPRISAPPDFEYRLKQTIAREGYSSGSRITRFFSFEQGRLFGIPTYAFGSLAAVCGIVFSLYVYRAGMEQPLLQNPRAVQESQPTEVPASDESSMPKEMQQSIDAHVEPTSPTPDVQSSPRPPTRSTGNEATLKSEEPIAQPQPAAPVMKQVLAPDENDVQAPLGFPAIRTLIPAGEAVGFRKDSVSVRDSLRRVDSLQRSMRTGPMRNKQREE